MTSIFSSHHGKITEANTKVVYIYYADLYCTLTVGMKQNYYIIDL